MTDGADWSGTVAAFTHAGDRALDMIRLPEVARRWGEASILEGFTVGGIAGHLYAVLRTFERRCDTQPPPTTVVVSPAANYAIARFDRDSDLDDPAFRVVREGGERVAARGHTAVADGFERQLHVLVNRLAGERHDRLVVLPDALTSATLHDYTETRIVELVVHADDLASSVGAQPEPPPIDAATIAIDFLVRAVRHRVGDSATLRALAGRSDGDVLRAL
jgi:hypothetical protein